MVIVIAVVIVVLVVVVFVGVFSRHTTPSLTRRLRSTSFSRRRSDAIRQAAAADVATILADDKYVRPDPSGPDSEL
jgi:hypothetical protein